MKKKIFALLVLSLVFCQVGFAQGNMMIDTTIGANKLAALKSDGTVSNYGFNLSDISLQSSLNGVVAVATEEVSGNSYFALKNDGTVSHVYRYKRPEFDVVSTWSNIIQIDAGNGFVAGVDANGKVYVCGNNLNSISKATSWIGIKSVYAKEDTLIGLDGEGKVYVASNLILDNSKVKNWIGMKKVVFDSRCFWGIDAQGNLVSSDNVYQYEKMSGKELVYDLKDIECLSAYAQSGYYSSILALKNDGTLLNVINYGTGFGSYKATVLRTDVDSVTTGTEKYNILLKNGQIISNTMSLIGPDWIMNVDITVNGKFIESDVEPFIENGRTMVPIRAISEAFGANVSYDDTTKTATIVKGTDTIKITMNNATAYVNGVAHTLDATAKNVSGRIFVPVRFISEGVGCIVDWLPNTKSVIING